MLAQGSPDDGLASYELIKDGSVNTAPLVPTPFFAREQPSAVQRCLQRHAMVRVDASTPDRCVGMHASSGTWQGCNGACRHRACALAALLRCPWGATALPAGTSCAPQAGTPACLKPPCRREELADWRQLRTESGCDWLLAAPLACTPARQHGSRLLGAVLVAGRGGAPSVDEHWLEEWAGEMASNIYHASILLMEVRGRALARGRGVGVAECTCGHLLPPP